MEPQPALLSPDTPAPGATLRVEGHFGELMQGRLGARGPVVLVTLPCPVLAVEVATETGIEAGARDAALLDPARAARLCAALGLTLPARLPPLVASMPPGGGAGASTAALVALARSLGFDGTPETLARACAEAEGASDPLMYPHPERLLFAPREGRVVRALPALPRFELVGGFHGPAQRTRAEDVDFPDIADLLARWERLETLAGMAALASLSAARTLAHRGPAGDPTEALAQRLGAAGWTIAHTGSARGLIFAPGTVPPGAEATLRAAGFAQVLRFAGGGA